MRATTDFDHYVDKLVRSVSAKPINSVTKVRCKMSKLHKNRFVKRIAHDDFRVIIYVIRVSACQVSSRSWGLAPSEAGCRSDSQSSETFQQALGLRTARSKSPAARI